MLVNELLLYTQGDVNIIIVENDGDIDRPLCTCRVDTGFTLSDFILNQLINFIEVPEIDTIVIWLVDTRDDISELLFKNYRENLKDGKET